MGYDDVYMNRYTTKTIGKVLDGGLEILRAAPEIGVLTIEV
jgi:hypothetical protein